MESFSQYYFGPSFMPSYDYVDVALPMDVVTRKLSMPQKIMEEFQQTFAVLNKDFQDTEPTGSPSSQNRK